jgi:hypothetical protein
MRIEGSTNRCWLTGDFGRRVGGSGNGGAFGKGEIDRLYRQRFE